jgi:hypothetical protein
MLSSETKKPPHGRLWGCAVTDNGALDWMILKFVLICVAAFVAGFLGVFRNRK